MMMKMIDKFDGEFAFLSNFYESPVSDGFTTFPTVEHYFQAAKAVWVKDYDDIQHAKTPGEAKRIGRKIAIRGDWESIKLDVMETAVREKFQIPELREKLLATGDAELIEGNWWHDNVWGNCSCDKCRDKEGQNWLGKILMGIRDELRARP
jgi:ribA/ribD-fused uncharacterized protein